MLSFSAAFWVAGTPAKHVSAAIHCFDGFEAFRKRWLGHAQIVGLLKMEPVSRRLIESARKQKREFCGLRSGSFDDMRNPHWRNAHGARERGLGQPKLFQDSARNSPG